jgi:hypothetical protein
MKERKNIEEYWQGEMIFGDRTQPDGPGQTGWS